MIVSRALIISFINSIVSIPVRISSDKLPRVNARSATGCGDAAAKGDVESVIGVATVGNASLPRVCGNRSENSRA